MQSKESISRREFLSRSAKAVAGVGVSMFVSQSAFGANEKVHVGLVGVGIRGSYLLRHLLNMDDVQVVAIADIYEGWLQRGVEMTKRKNPNVKGYDHYRKLIADKDVQAVVIATPEHTHARMFIDAANAGKDVFVEKPMCHTLEEAQAMVEAARRNNIVSQVGTQRRSCDVYMKAREIVQSGQIGQITLVRAFWYRNSRDDRPQWRYPIPEGASEKNIKWHEFLMGAPYRPFDLHRYFQWRCYWDYSRGIATDLMVHQVDAVNMIMGSKFPKAAVGMGSIVRFHEFGRETPDVWNCIMEFPEGFYLNYSSTFSNEHYGYGEQFLGQSGTIEFVGDNMFRLYPERAGMKKVPEMEVRSEDPYPAPRMHLQNFIDCVRTRKRTNCPVDEGQYAITAALMAVKAFNEKRTVFWEDIAGARKLKEVFHGEHKGYGGRWAE